MKISIIVPVYNVEKYVHDCIMSIMNQDYQDIECIIVNDCTPDDSMAVVNELLDSYTGHVQFRIINKIKNEGLSAARNSGIRESTGTYVFLIDSDDYLSTNHAISTFVEYASKYPDAEIISGHYQGYLEEGNFPKLDVEYVQTQNELKRSVLFSYYYGLVWNRLLKKDFLESNGLFFDEGYVLEDTVWNIKSLPFVKNHVVIPDVTYYYRPNVNGASRSKNYSLHFKSRLNLLRYLFQIKVHDEDRPLYYFYTAFDMLSCASTIAIFDNLDESDVMEYKSFSSLFRKQIMLSHPIMTFIAILLYSPFRKMLANRTIRNKSYSILLKYREQF